MPQLSCPYEGCDWKSQDLDAAFAAALNTSLGMHDKAAHSQAPVSNLKLIYLVDCVNVINMIVHQFSVLESMQFCCVPK